jgi:flagellar assembly protein FliH
MSKLDSAKIISANSQTAYERYEIPSVKSRQQQKQEHAGMLTARQLEELQQQAYDEGFQQGKKEGYQAGFKESQEEGMRQGLQDGQEEVRHIVKRFEQIMAFLSEPLEQMNQTVEDELFALSMATAKQIIRREIHADPGQIIAVIKEAIRALPAGANTIKVFLHPADAEIARENLKLSSEKMDKDTVDELWTIYEEPVLTRGGCRIETEASLIDATIETRLAEIAAQIMGSERAKNRSNTPPDSEPDPQLSPSSQSTDKNDL